MTWVKKWSKVAGVWIVLGSLVACLWGSIEFHAFHANYYKREYEKLNTAEQIGMSEEGLFEATDALLDYLKGKREDISCVQEVNGVEREVFDQRETAHMVDVLALYKNAKMACFVLIAFGVVSLLLVIYFVKTNKIKIGQVLYDIQSGFRQVMLAFLIVVSGLVFYAIVDFTAFWTAFHKLFFNNDLWLLDPNVSIMINMFPEEFFFGMVMRIVITFIISFCGMSCLYFYFQRRVNQKRILD